MSSQRVVYLACAERRHLYLPFTDIQGFTRGQHRRQGDKNRPCLQEPCFSFEQREQVLTRPNQLGFFSPCPWNPYPITEVMIWLAWADWQASSGRTASGWHKPASNAVESGYTNAVTSVPTARCFLYCAAQNVQSLPAATPLTSNDACGSRRRWVCGLLKQ